MMLCSATTRTFYSPEASAPVAAPTCLSTIAAPSLRSLAHTDRGIRTPTSSPPRVNTTGTPAAAPPAAATHPATGSTTAAGRSTAPHPARPGTAARSPPRGTSRTPSAANSAARPGAPRRAPAPPAAARPPTPSTSTPATPSPCTPSCSPGHAPAPPGRGCPLELRDDVLLVAAAVRLEHQLVGRGGAVVGDEEEVAVFLAQPHRTPVDPQPLAEHHHAIGRPAGRRAIVERGHHLLQRMDRLE